MKRVVLLAGLLFLMFYAPSAHAREPICPGAPFHSLRPDILFCDDFEDGTWLDTWDSGGGAPPVAAGKNAVVCGNRGASDDCMATDLDETMMFDGQGFSGYYAETKGSIPFPADFYFRFYYRQSAGWIAGNVGSKIIKIRNINLGNCIVVTNCINNTLGSYSTNKIFMDNANGSNAVPADTPPGAGGSLTQNVVGNSIVTVDNHWYLIEMHIKLNTPGVANGIYEQWLDDVTVNPGVTLATQTLVSSWTGRRWRFSNILPNNIQLGAYWQDTRDFACACRAYSPAPGQHEDWDNIVMGTARIGPRSASISNALTIPAAPTGLAAH